MKVAIAAAAMALAWLVNAAGAHGAGPAAPQSASSCGVSTTPLTFGTYRVLDSTPKDAAGSIEVDCTGRVSVRISLDPGYHGSTQARAMRGPIDFLEYQVYVDQARQIPWGNGTGGALPQSASFAGSQTFTVYGRIPARQHVGPGEYADTLVVSVSF